ncbi:MAG: putative toxin-antitoxin system toxin component, PIN family [Bacteroidales bacterium]|nr:putative toxin-antitoxin system toxin component, PIN family [Bacteroidales bacterium]
MMKIYAVIDTNILVSALITRNPDAATRIVISSVNEGRIAPMINPEIIKEYGDVLVRDKFGFSSDDVSDMLELFAVRGKIYIPQQEESDFRDADDYIFYATYGMKEGAYLVTGNLRHFPVEPRIVSPSDMVNILYSCREEGVLLSEPQMEYMSEERLEKLTRAAQAMERMRQAAAANGISDMSMEEIDEEIRRVRKHCI